MLSTEWYKSDENRNDSLYPLYKRFTMKYRPYCIEKFSRYNNKAYHIIKQLNIITTLGLIVLA